MSRLGDPKRYVDWYRQGGYGFPRQALVEDFWSLVSTALATQRKRWEDEILSNRTTQEEIERKLESSDISQHDALELGEFRRDNFKDIWHCEAQLRDLQELLNLGEELVLLAIYKFIELERNRVLSTRFPHLEGTTLSDFRGLTRELPFLKTLYGFEAIDELRLICNAIKHSGRVSSALAKCHPSWHPGEPLSNLRGAYERIAPYVGAYFIALMNGADDYAEQIARYAQSIAGDG